MGYTEQSEEPYKTAQLIKELKEENTKLRECVELIANDDGDEDNMVCKSYSDLRYCARQCLKELNTEN